MGNQNSNESAKKSAGGRPSTYSEDIAKKVCELTATSSKSLKTICEELDLAPSTVLDWLSDKKEFSEMYARAKDLQADYLAEEILEIADDGTNDYMTITKGDIQYNVEDREVTNRSKLRVEARKWIAAKLKPRKYSEKLDVTSNGESITPIDLSKVPTEVLMQLLNAIGEPKNIPGAS